MKRVAQFERTTRDIVNAFWSLMKKKDFDKITVQDLTEEAMINRSTFYQHFADKYAIVEYLNQTLIDEFTVTCGKLRQDKQPSFEELDQILNQYFSEHWTQLHVLFSIKTPHLDLSKEIRQQLTEYLKSFRPELSELEASMMSGLLFEYFSDRLKRDQNTTESVRDLFHACRNLALALFDLTPSEQTKQDFEVFLGAHRVER